MRRPEMDSEADMELPTVGRTLRLFGRALLLRLLERREARLTLDDALIASRLRMS